MRFLSLFSGIEAASVAWLPLGWECVAVAEVEPFPCAVLKHHYPDVVNLGDVTKITKDQIEALGHIDVVILGFPCQDLSVAGQRKGLKNADGTITRSGLFFIAMQICEWSRSRWIVGENVPGLFSSNGGRDFAAVVGELAGCEFDVPGDGWRASGVALGPKGLVEWFVLDAQWRGLAQRRNRVFLVRDSGNWADRPPFFPLTKSLFRHPPPRRPERQGTTHSLAARTRGGGGLGTDAECDGAVIPINMQAAAKNGAKSPNMLGIGQPGDPAFTCNASDQHAIAATLRSHPFPGSNSVGAITHSLRSDGFDASKDGTGRGTPIVPTLTGNGDAHSGFKDESGLIPEIVPQAMSSKWSKGSSGPAGDEVANMIPVAFQTRIARNGRGDMGDKVNALNAQSGETGKGDAAPCVATGMAVRRLTPTECARLQGFPDNYLDILFNKKPATDGHKYKALGNSFAVPVVAWIGRRIELVHNL